MLTAETRSRKEETEHLGGKKENRMKFALIGAAGFVAERHIKAIKETGNQLVCEMDPFDVKGRMDN